MTEQKIPDQHHVVRYIKPTLVHGNAVHRSAFVLPEKHAGISVNWLEVFGVEDIDQSIRKVRRLIRLNLSKNGKFARLNTGKTRDYVYEESSKFKRTTSIEFVSKPLSSTDAWAADESHAEIVGVPSASESDAVLISTLISDCVLAPLYSATE